MKTVKAYNERERHGLLWERLRYHEAMVRAHTTTHEAIIASSVGLEADAVRQIIERVRALRADGSFASEAMQGEGA